MGGLRTAIALLWLVLQPVIFHWNAVIRRTTYVPWDLPGFHTPLESGVVEALSRHRLPLWDPYTYAGYPLHANSQAQIFYPLAWPVFAKTVWSKPGQLFYWLEWETVLHISLAGLFTWWLLRRAGCGYWPALFGATVYQLGFFFTSQVQHLGAVCAAAWMPLVWLALLELARRFSWPWFGALAAALALSFLAGFMAMTLVVYGSAVALALGLWISRRAQARVLGWTALAILASLLLIAAQLVPTAMWGPHSHASLRWMWAPGEGIPPYALLSAIRPDWFHVFEPDQYKERFNLTFMYFYSGQAALWLALAAPWLRTSLPARLFGGLAAVFTIVMFGSFTPGYLFLFHLLPHAVQGAVYIHFVMAAVSLAVAIAAALALAHIGSGRRAWVAAVVTVATCLELWAVGSNRSLNTAQGSWKLIDSCDIYFERYSTLPVLRGWLYATTPPERLDSTQDNYRFATPAPATRLPALNGDDPFAPLRLLHYRQLFATGPYWIRRYPVADAASPLLPAANVGFLLHHGDVPDLPALKAAGWEEIPWGDGKPLHVFRNSQVLPRYYLVPEVRAAESADAALRVLKGIDPRRVAVVEGAADAPASGATSPTPVEVVSYRPDRVELRATLDSPAYLVAAESWAPGWRARVNGRAARLYPTNLAFQGLPLAAGRQDIVLEYVPTAAYVAFVVSALSWLVLGCGMIYASRRSAMLSVPGQ
jgi:hypothetical protein